MITVAAWNVNSVNARIERLLAFLKRNSPDVLLIQELKCLEEKYPAAAIKEAGYHSAVFGQKTYNGVAILSKIPPRNIVTGLMEVPGEKAEEARFIEANIGGVFFMSAYIPNGQELGAPKYQFKLEWLKQLRAYLDRAHKDSDKIIIGGDFNICRDDRDTHDPVLWKDQIFCSKPERAGFEEIISFGLQDTFRMHNEAGGFYSWWDYRALGFPLNKGLRIDYLFATPSMAEKCTAAWIERDERKGEKPSDHAPILSKFDYTLA